MATCSKSPPLLYSSVGNQLCPDLPSVPCRADSLRHRDGWCLGLGFVHRTRKSPSGSTWAWIGRAAARIRHRLPHICHPEPVCCPAYPLYLAGAVLDNFRDFCLGSNYSGFYSRKRGVSPCERARALTWRYYWEEDQGIHPSSTNDAQNALGTVRVCGTTHGWCVGVQTLEDVERTKMWDRFQLPFAWFSGSVPHLPQDEQGFRQLPFDRRDNHRKLRSHNVRLSFLISFCMHIHFLFFLQRRGHRRFNFAVYRPPAHDCFVCFVKRCFHSALDSSVWLRDACSWRFLRAIWRTGCVGCDPHTARRDEPTRIPCYLPRCCIPTRKRMWLYSTTRLVYGLINDSFLF